MSPKGHSFFLKYNMALSSCNEPEIDFISEVCLKLMMGKNKREISENL